MTDIPRHKFSEVSEVCKRCGWPLMDLYRSSVPLSCMTDEEIEWTKQQSVGRYSSTRYVQEFRNAVSALNR